MNALNAKLSVPASLQGAVLLSVMMCIGCGGDADEAGMPPVDPQVLAQYRSQILLTEEPADGIVLLEARNMLEEPTGSPDAAASEQTNEAQPAADASASDDTDALAAQPASTNQTDSADQTVPPSSGTEPVTIVGLIGGMPNPWIDTEPAFPWKEGAAAFYLVDPPTAMEFDSGGHVHDDPNECPFCSASARGRLDAFALVSLVDAEGNPLPIDARQLLDVTTPATVVVRGKARLMGEMMAIEADGIYVRQ